MKHVQYSQNVMDAMSRAEEYVNSDKYSRLMKLELDDTIEKTVETAYYDGYMAALEDIKRGQE